MNNHLIISFIVITALNKVGALFSALFVRFSTMKIYLLGMPFLVIVNR